MAELGRLHVITDRLPIAAAALDAGAPVIQVRAKDATDAEVLDLTCRVLELAAPHGATVVVDDRLDVALAAGAHGVHVGEHDLPVGAARQVAADPAFVVGGTARDPLTARAYQIAGATYLGVGPCYATSSKVGLPEPEGAERVRAVAAAVSIPVIAIAGVTAARIPELLEAGAHGVAVIGAIRDADDPRAATRELLAALEAVQP
ncbi:thiamine phosphate synthase [Rhabdothermincola sediminis]|uniref:thiamine phosphate synthase n=1 Tax=Rhabdothermincola sediminis TaxID=2751370 RepID=UPI001AA05C8E|nr:thiamine phosphate synthase [Rhabdothermincola sediminis]